VRVTGVLIEDGQVLLLNQDTDTGRGWSLPGGKVDERETIADALVREMHEETGLRVEVGRLLYVCDHITDDVHVVHLTFEVRRVGGHVKVAAGADTRAVRGVEFVKLSEPPRRGFGEQFGQLAMQGFPGAGSYKGAKTNIGL
jgi:ADP-ribose pyrophosphatase YjhB (NUDIX family)